MAGSANMFSWSSTWAFSERSPSTVSFPFKLPTCSPPQPCAPEDPAFQFSEKTEGVRESFLSSLENLSAFQVLQPRSLPPLIHRDLSLALSSVTPPCAPHPRSQDSSPLLHVPLALGHHQSSPLCYVLATCLCTLCDFRKQKHKQNPLLPLTLTSSIICPQSFAVTFLQSITYALCLL